ncbi:MAG TPA: helix-turn-helix transcriptional regulator [Pseudonocardiaceae bacterium]|jgi:transcriptional regulator with XRE-family HTH domain|nr:helix-turn-helix transcriptional regulator [Pseudonocardiaceae bacterium]
MPRSRVGPLIRDRRVASRRSQLQLALDAGVSTRHLGFVELDKSRPSPELLLAIADCLEVPLRERNQWLLAAGHAPRYPETPLAGPELARVRGSLQALLDAHDPYPGVVVDRRWDVRLTNAAARTLVAGIPAEVRGTPTNIFRAALHPDGLASHTRNFAEWSAYLLRQLHLLAVADPEAAALATEIATWQGIPPRATWHRATRDGNGTDPVLTWQVRLGDRDHALYTIMSTIGTPNDITLAELTVELFFPADPATERLLRR